ncbi:MAG: rRNA adenine N-6-methyltransferase family protein, partial [Anaerolineae bacterium]
MKSTHQLLKQYALHPQKSLGQNFLADPNHLQKIIEAAELSPTDVALEIGPGLGALIARLVEA